MLKNEWKYIGKNRLILISLIAIVFIPFLYSIFFLKSVWDPYGETSKLPVAVVNEDQPVTYQGKTLDVGNQTVANLKKNHQLGWRFVNADQANQGLKDRKYYTVITIPQNFSANAATATSAHPKKMNLRYKTNGSYNYISQVMSEVGADRLNSEISAKVTKAYAEATFDQIFKVGKGMTKAASGAAQLKDGTVTLTDGLNTYTTGVGKVNDGVQTLQTKVQPLANGVQKLTTGSLALQSGLSTYTGGVSQVNSGVKQLKAGTGPLSRGVAQLDTGANQLNTGLYKYVNGVYQLNDGIQQLNGKVGPLKSGVNQLYTGSSQLTAGLKKLNSNSGALRDGSGQLKTNAKSLSDGLAQLDSYTGLINAQLDGLKGQLGSLNSDKGQQQISAINAIIADLKDSSVLDHKDDYIKVLDELASIQSDRLAIQSDLQQLASNLSPKQTAQVQSGLNAVDNLASQTKDLQTLSGQIKADASDPTAVKADAAKLASLSQDTNDNAQKAQSILDSISDLLNSLQENTGIISKMVATLHDMNTRLINVVGRTSDLDPQKDGSQKFLTDLAQLNVDKSDLTQLQTALGQLGSAGESIDKLQTFVNGVSTINAAVNKGNPTLYQGVSDLNTGITQYTDGVSAAFDGSKQLNTGLGTMQKQMPALISGVQKMATGGKQLKANGGKLTAGSRQLATGLDQMHAQVPTLVSGVNQLYAGTSKLNANSPKLNSGASQLAGGLTTLNGNIPALSSGIGQLAAGTSQLAQNSPKLMAGANKLKGGNGQLATSLKQGADQINSQPLTDKTADQFATPTTLSHDEYSYVPNYGHALAPYVLSLALYVGAIVFNFAFPIRKVSMTGGTATAWYLSKISVGAVVAVGMAIIEPTFMMVGGLHVDHPFQMYVLAIIFALASMYIVMFLSMLLDNPGRFLAMVLLMLQLGGSGGTFPMEVTNSFYNFIHPLLPMSYSILGFREALTSGLGSGVVVQGVLVLLLFIIINLGLLWLSMQWLQRKHLMGVSQLDNNQQLQAVEDPNTNAHS